MFGTLPTIIPLAGLLTLIVSQPSAAVHSPPTEHASRKKEESFSVRDLKTL
jgi:hypothetical protein